jgi:hypothetical protein
MKLLQTVIDILLTLALGLILMFSLTVMGSILVSMANKAGV